MTCWMTRRGCDRDQLLWKAVQNLHSSPTCAPALSRPAHTTEARQGRSSVRPINETCSCAASLLLIISSEARSPANYRLTAAATCDLRPATGRRPSTSINSRHDLGLGALPPCHLPRLGGNGAHSSLQLLRSQCQGERASGRGREGISEDKIECMDGIGCMIRLPGVRLLLYGATS